MRTMGVSPTPSERLSVIGGGKGVQDIEKCGQDKSKEEGKEKEKRKTDLYARSEFEKPSGPD